MLELNPYTTRAISCKFYVFGYLVLTTPNGQYPTNTTIRKPLKFNEKIPSS